MGWGTAVQLGVLAAGTLIGYLRSRQREDFERRLIPLSRELDGGAPGQWVLGTARTPGQRVGRKVAPEGEFLENAFGASLHLAQAISFGEIDGLDAIHINGERYALMVRGTRSSPGGGTIYSAVSRTPPYGDLFAVVLHTRQDGQGGDDWFTVSGTSAPFLTGISWAHVVLAGMNEEEDQRFTSQPRIEFEVRGIKLPPAINPTGAARHTSSATDIRRWFHADLLGETDIDADSVAASAAITDAMLTTEVTGEWWKFLDTPMPPPAAGWQSAPITPTAANPVTFAAVQVLSATSITDLLLNPFKWRVIPWQIWNARGEVETIGVLPTENVVQVQYRASEGNAVSRLRYEINGVLSADDRVQDVLDEFDFCWAGMVQRRGGVLHFKPGTDVEDPVAALDAVHATARDVTVGVPPRDIVTQIQPKLAASRPDGFNAAELPAVGDDDSRPLRLEGMRFVVDPFQAGRLVATNLRQLRDRNFAYTFPVTPTILGLVEGDLVTLTDTASGQNNLRARLEYLRFHPDPTRPRADLVIRPEPVGVYADTVDLSSAPDDMPVDLTPAPVPANFDAVLDHRYLDDGTPRPAIRASWDPTNSYRTEVRVRAQTERTDARPEPEPTTTTDTDQVYILSAANPGRPTGGERLRTHVPSGWTRVAPRPSATQGIWRSRRTRSYSGGVFVSATAWGDPVRVVAPGASPGAPEVPGLRVQGGSREVEATAIAATSGNPATLYRFQLFALSDLSDTPMELTSADVGPVTFTGLLASTSYYVHVRAENSAGESDYSMAMQATTEPPPVVMRTTDIDAVFRLSATTPATPTGGEDEENHVPTDWDRIAPSPSATEGVWQVRRRRVFVDGVFEYAQMWNPPELIAPAEPVAPDPPGVPGLEVVGGIRQVVATVTAPTMGGDPALYRIQLSTDPNFGGTPMERTLTDAGDVTFMGLDPETEYHARARCENTGGDSDWSATDTASTFRTPPVVPATAIFYSIDRTSLWAVNVTSPQFSEEIGTLPAAMGSPRGIALHEGDYYAANAGDDTLWRLDTGRPSRSTSLGSLPAGLTIPEALASHGGMLYCVDRAGPELWRLDLATPGDSVNLGALPAALGTPEGIASFGGRLYAIKGGAGRGQSGTLWELDTTTPGDSVNLGTLPANLQLAVGLTEHAGELYCLDRRVDGGVFWQINTSDPGQSRRIDGMLTQSFLRGYGLAEVPAPGIPTLSVQGRPSSVAATVGAPPTGVVIRYRIEISLFTDFRILVALAFRPTPGTTTITGLADGTTYYLRVRAERGGLANSRYSPVRSATPILPTVAPGRPVLASVTGGARQVQATVTAPSSGGEVQTYRFQLSRNADFRLIESTTTLLVPGSVTFSGLAPGQTYYVRVRAENVVGNSAYTSGQAAQTDAELAAPGVPTVGPLIPVGTSIVVGITAGSGGTPSLYRFQLSTNADFSGSPTEMTNTEGVTFTGLMAGTTYYVRARAENDAGDSDWSAGSMVMLPSTLESGEPIEDLASQAPSDPLPGVEVAAIAPPAARQVTAGRNLGGYPVSYAVSEMTAAPEGYPIPPPDPMDPETTEFTDFRSVVVPVGVSEVFIDAPLGFRYRAQGRHIGSTGPGPWSDEIDVLSTGALDESPTEVDAFISDRVSIRALAPERRDVNGIEVVMGDVEVPAAAFRGVVHAVSPGKPVSIEHQPDGISLLDSPPSVVQVRFVTRTGLAGPIALAAIARPDLRPYRRVVVYEGDSPPDGAPYMDGTLFARVTDSG